MKTTLRTDLTVTDICAGFVYNQLEGRGLFGLGGKLTIQPEVIGEMSVRWRSRRCC